MHIPPGVDSEGGTVWLLHKVLYGLKQASREWYLKLKGQLEELGFKRNNADHGIFTKNIIGKIFVITVYVDDFLLFSSNIDDIKAIKEDLKKRFEMKDLEEASWILQMKIKRSNMNLESRTLSISQEQYVEAILEWHSMANCNPARTPMGNGMQLPNLTESKVNITKYQRCIRSLMYLMVCTCPDIAYSVGVLSCHVTCPGRIYVMTWQND